MGLGLNQGGLSVARWLIKHGSKLTITDLKSARKLRSSLEQIKKISQSNRVKYVLGRHDPVDFKTHDLIIKNPGVPNNSPYLKIARSSGIPIVNEALMFFGLFGGPKIGVTGTRGKSTTASLIHHILKTEIRDNVLAGNIATTAMMSVVDSLAKRSWPVLELSSWQLESLDEYGVSPELAVITNVLVDHLNRYKNFAAYRRAKLALVRHQHSHDRAVLNFDNPHTRSFASQTPAQIYWFSLEEKIRGAYLSRGYIHFYDGHKDSRIMPIRDIHLQGRHNLANVLAAVAVAKLLDVSHKNIIRVLRSFSGLKYRLEYLGRLGHLQVYNDATSTTPDAVLAALQALADKPIILMAGGEDKKLDYRELARQIKRQLYFLVLLKGSGSQKLLSALKKISFPVQKLKTGVEDLSQAWRYALEQAPPQPAYLLFSPGATSFNMFINEFDRAQQLEKLFYASQKKK